MNVILFEMSTSELLLLFCRRKRQNIIIDRFVYTAINIHSNLFFVYEKVTYQIININLRKSTKMRNYLISHTNLNVTVFDGDKTKILVSDIKWVKFYRCWNS